MKRRQLSPNAVELRERRRDQTRRRLLQAGRQALAEDRLLTTSLAEIASQADLTTGAIYDHFGSREEFVIAVATAAAEDLEPAAAPALDGTLEDFYAASAAYIAELAGRQAALGKLILALKAEAALNPALAERMRGTWTVGRPEVVAQLKAMAERSGVELLVSAHELDLVLGSLLAGLLEARVLLGREAVPDQVFQKSVRLVLSALVKPAD